MLYDTLGFGLRIARASNPPYNAADTVFFESEFRFEQSLIFEFDKNSELNKSFENAIKMMLNVMLKLDTRALLYTSMFQDLCFFDNLNCFNRPLRKLILQFKIINSTKQI